MARRATILRQVTDAWGDPWDVREERKTDHGWPLCLGWPLGVERGQGAAGGPRVIVTAELAAHFERHRRAPQGLALPIGNTAIKRIRRLLGHHRQIDAASWWEERISDLADLTIQAFAAQHDCSVGAVVHARHALFGPKLRPAGWWRAPDVAALLISPLPTVEIADRLGIAVGSARRLRGELLAEPV